MQLTFLYSQNNNGGGEREVQKEMNNANALQGFMVGNVSNGDDEKKLHLIIN